MSKFGFINSGYQIWMKCIQVKRQKSFFKDGFINYFPNSLVQVLSGKRILLGTIHYWRGECITGLLVKDPEAGRNLWIINPRGENWIFLIKLLKMWHHRTGQSMMLKHSQLYHCEIYTLFSQVSLVPNFT